MEITGFRHQTSRILPLRIDLYGNELWLFRPNDSNGHGNADWQSRDRGVEFRDGVYPLAVDRGDHIANVYVPRFTWALPDRNHNTPCAASSATFSSAVITRTSSPNRF